MPRQETILTANREAETMLHLGIQESVLRDNIAIKFDGSNGIQDYLVKMARYIVGLENWLRYIVAKPNAHETTFDLSGMIAGF